GRARTARLRPADGGVDARGAAFYRRRRRPTVDPGPPTRRRRARELPGPFPRHRRCYAGQGGAAAGVVEPDVHSADLTHPDRGRTALRRFRPGRTGTGVGAAMASGGPGRRRRPSGTVSQLRRRWAQAVAPTRPRRTDTALLAR